MIALLLGGDGSAPAVEAQQSAPRGSSAVEVIFEVRTSPERLGGATDDLLTILFSNVSAEQQRTPPKPLFGDDVVAEFSFSGRDARPGATMIMRRLLADVSFINARYVRVVNHGADAWGGEWISLSVAGRRVLDRQTLYPRKGAHREAGIEKFNPLQWYERIYWEEDLQKIRRDRAAAR
jgi:hypothetical protein